MGGEDMSKKEVIQKIKLEIQKGMQLAKCKKCGCMKETLKNLLEYLPEIEESSGLIKEVKAWLKEMEPVKYACLGCNYCFPAVATNILTANIPSLNQSASLNCNFEVKEETWPPVAGEYFAFCEGPDCPVAVSTLASVELAEALANIKPKGLCIVGKTETENIGIEKIIKNTITNPTIHYLIVAGKDPNGHRSGSTLLALSERGVNKDMKVIGSPGKRPILKNVSLSEVETFRKQVQVIDMLGCEDTEKIMKKIDELTMKSVSTCKCKEYAEPKFALPITSAPKILAAEPKRLKLDKV